MASSKLALALAAVLALAADAAPQRSVTPRGLPAQRLSALVRDVPATCGACKWVVSEGKCLAEDPDTQAELLAMVTTQLCPSLPEGMSAQCVQLAPALIPSALWYLSTFSSGELCSDVALCGAAPVPSVSAQQGLKAVADNSTCAMCSYVQESELGSAEACSALPAEFQASCHSVAAAAGSKDCVASGLCVAPWASALAAADLPLTLPPALVSALSKGLLSRHSRLVLGPALPGSMVGDYELCDICRSIVAEAAIILSNPDTQKQALEVMKQACAGLGDFQNQCLSYVELYGPLVFNIVVQYLNTEACAKIGYCPATTVELHASGRGIVAA